MSLKEKFAIYGNATLFQILWFAAVIGAREGLQWPALTTLGLMLFWAFLFGNQTQADLRMAFTGLIVAFTVEPVWIGQGLVVYPLQPEAFFPPLWIVTLWIGFAISFNHSLRWLKNRYGLCAILGGAGSLLSMSGAWRLGAIELPGGWLTICLYYSSVWVVIAPALAWFSGRKNSDEDFYPERTH